MEQTCVRTCAKSFDMRIDMREKKTCTLACVCKQRSVCVEPAHKQLHCLILQGVGDLLTQNCDERDGFLAHVLLADWSAVISA